MQCSGLTENVNYITFYLYNLQETYILFFLYRDIQLQKISKVSQTKSEFEICLFVCCMFAHVDFFRTHFERAIPLHRVQNLSIQTKLFKHQKSKEHGRQSRSE